MVDIGRPATTEQAPRRALDRACHAAGQAFIRRTIRGSGNPVVHETDWLLTPAADCLFRRILLGQAH